MNSDSFMVYRSDYPSGHPFLTQTLALTTTAEQVFQITGPQNAIISVPSQSAIQGVRTSFDPNTNPATLSSGDRSGMYANRPRPGFSSTSFDGRAFRVRACVKFNNQAGTTNAQTITFRIRQGTNASGTVVVAQTGGTNTAANGTWLGEAFLVWDATEQYLFGLEDAFIASQTGAAVVAQTQVNGGTPINVTAYTSLQFVPTIQVSTTNSTSTATLVEFSMEQV